VKPGEPAKAAKLQVTIREAGTGTLAGQGRLEIPAAGDGPERTGRVTIPIRNCHLWSPESPFLYELEVRGQADATKTRFGMRTFSLDPATGRAMLNGKPYFMRGSNVTIYRFFEDPERGDKPWRPEWVRRLHKAFRNMHMNSLRYCIGFPPDFWYRITDEDRQAPKGIAVGKPAKASSNMAQSGATSPAAAVDGRSDTRWSSEFSDPQWIAVDLGKPTRISRIVLDWENAFAKAYTVEVSLDGQTWKEVYRTDNDRGGSEEVKFTPVEARWVRITGTKRATVYGYSLWELRVFRG